MVDIIICNDCRKRLKNAGAMSADDWDKYGEWVTMWIPTIKKYLDLCPKCYRKRLGSWSIKRLVEYISDKTYKLCWTELANVINELKLRINKDD